MIITICLIVSISYAIVLLWYTNAAKKLPSFKGETISSNVQFSVIIPYRNEEKHLETLFKSLESIHYKKEDFEVFLVNDDSTDASEELAHRFSKSTSLNITCLSQEAKSTSPKKSAIELAIHQANFDWIITTDADCIVPNLWLRTLSDFIQTNHTTMVVMPVFISSISGIYIEAIEMCALQTITMGSFNLRRPLMNNGANLAFSKKSFISQNGYAHHKDIASGDDLFLLESFYKHKEPITYLKSKSVIVKTEPQKSYNSYVQQRVRWASKSTKSNNKNLKLLGLLIALTNSTLLFLLVFGVITQNLIPFTLLYLIKLTVDFYLIEYGERFFERSLKLNLIWANLFYALLSVYIFTHSLAGGYTWKGRQFNR